MSMQLGRNISNDLINYIMVCARLINRMETYVAAEIFKNMHLCNPQGSSMAEDSIHVELVRVGRINTYSTFNVRT